MVLLGGKEISEVLDFGRRWVLDSIDGSPERGQCDNVQGNVMESRSNVYDAGSSITEFFLNGIEKLGPLGPKYRR